MRSRPGACPDQERFRTLYPRLLRFAAVVAPPEDDPNDLVHEAVARTLRRQLRGALRAEEAW